MSILLTILGVIFFLYVLRFLFFLLLPLWINKKLREQAKKGNTTSGFRGGGADAFHQNSSTYFFRGVNNGEVKGTSNFGKSNLKEKNISGKVKIISEKRGKTEK